MQAGWQEQLLEGLAGRLHSHPGVVGVFLLGSEDDPAANENEADLLLVVDEASRPQFSPAVRLLEKFGRVATSQYVEDDGQGLTHVAYKDGRHVELVVTTDESPVACMDLTELRRRMPKPAMTAASVLQSAPAPHPHRAGFPGLGVVHRLLHPSAH